MLKTLIKLLKLKNLITFIIFTNLKKVKNDTIRFKRQKI